jgi:putative phosphonate metabolism protein
MIQPMNIHRAALYYAPAPGSAWHAFGSRWLGRDAVSGQELPQPPLPGVDLHALTSEPRRYGFHATLKAPFRLAEGTTLESLREAMETFTQAQRALPLGLLSPQWMDGYVALLPAPEARPAILKLAGQVVEAFEPFRAPLSEAELARRHPDSLTPRQNALLAQYGYPYVQEEFRFHMTLSNSVDARQADTLITAVAGQLEALRHAPPRLDAIALFVEPAPCLPFIAVRRCPLRG